jgi:hypothetical protein
MRQPRTAILMASSRVKDPRYHISTARDAFDESTIEHW